MKQLSCVIGLFVAVSIAAPAFAGIADSPLPVLLAGKKTLHIYSVPGVMSASCFETYFSCTSTDVATMQVGVELFFGSGGAPANDAVATSLSVAPGATVIFGTGTGADIFPNSVVGGVGSRGSARILSTSKKLACTAFIADACNAPPTSMVYLTIIKKTTQKGE
jgi:hypothetical protein